MARMANQFVEAKFYKGQETCQVKRRGSADSTVAKRDTRLSAKLTINQETAVNENRARGYFDPFQCNLNRIHLIVLNILETFCPLSWLSELLPSLPLLWQKSSLGKHVGGSGTLIGRYSDCSQARPSPPSARSRTTHSTRL